MTNFRIDNGQIIGVVDIFEIDSSNENQIKWIDSVVNSLFTGNYFWLKWKNDKLCNAHNASEWTEQNLN